jgi:hypothetical protein
MQTIPQSVRTVKSPYIPPEDDEADPRLDSAQSRFASAVAKVEAYAAREGDTSVFQAALQYLEDCLADHDYFRKARARAAQSNRSPLDCLIPMELAEQIASGAWRIEP